MGKSTRGKRCTLFRRDNGVWYLSVKGRRVSLETKDEKVASLLFRAKEVELQKAAVANVVDMPDLSTTTFEDLSDDYLDWHEQHNSPSSNERVRSIFKTHLNPHFGTMAIERVALGKAEQYKRDRLETDDPPKTATLNKEINTLKAFMNWAEKHEKITRNRLRGLRLMPVMDAKAVRYYTKNELGDLYANSDTRAGDEARAKDGGKPVNSQIRDYGPIWRFMANTGLRRAEMLKLRWSQVGTDNIRIEGRTKSGKWRQVPLNEGAKASIDTLAELYGRSGLVLPRISPASLTRAFNRCAGRAGLDGSLHTLRHTYCSHLAMNGIDIFTIKELAGHSSVEVTKKYMHLSPDWMKGAVEGLEL